MLRVHITCLLICLLAGAVRIADAQGREARPLPIEDALSARVFSEYSTIAFSPDDQSIVFALRQAQSGDGEVRWSAEVLARTGLPWWGVQSSIWTISTHDGSMRRVSPTGGNAWSPSWSPDGRFVAFISDVADRSGERFARLWVWDASTGHSRPVSSRNVRSDAIVWSRDGSRALVKLVPEGATSGDTRHSVPPQEPETGYHPGSSVRVYGGEQKDTTVGLFPLEPPLDLVWIDIETGSMEPVVRRERIGTVRISPDGRSIAYSAPRGWEPSVSQILYDLVVLKNAASPTVVATGVRLNNHDGAQFTWAPDGRRLAYQETGLGADGSVNVIALDKESSRRIAPGDGKLGGSQVSPPLWDATGTHVYVAHESTIWKVAADGSGASPLAVLAGRTVRLLPGADDVLWSPDRGRSTIVATRDNETAHSGFVRIALSSGAATELLSEPETHGGYDDRVTSGFAVANDGRRLVYLSEGPEHGRDLFLLEGGFRSGTRLSDVNPELRRYALGQRRVIEWRTLDGDTVRGVLLLPAGYQPGKRYPLITSVYGGSMPTRRQVNRFGLASSPPDNLQIFATRGYAVFLPDLPLARPGRVMLDLLKIVLPGVDRVIEMGIADPDRLGVTGHSFGGYNTIALIVQTTRFRAAMMNAGLANPVSAYGSMMEDGSAYNIGGLERGQFLLHGTPWEVRSRYLDNSPILHLDQVETPLLIVHGEKDIIVQPFLAEEVFVGLRRLGKKVMYAKYMGEYHGQQTWSYSNQVDFWERTLRWFDEHLKGEAIPEDANIAHSRE